MNFEEMTNIFFSIVAGILYGIWESNVFAGIVAAVLAYLCMRALDKVEVIAWLQKMNGKN